MSCSKKKTILLIKDYKNQEVKVLNVCHLSIMTIKQMENKYNSQSFQFQVNFLLPTGFSCLVIVAHAV
jgi:hypothetical protein